MYLQDLDIGIPTQTLVNRDCIDQGVLFEDRPGLVSCVDCWWFARLLQHGDLLLVNEPLIEQHQGDHPTVTASVDDRALDAEFQALRGLLFPLLDPGLRPPPVAVANQSVRVIRALHRLSRRQPPMRCAWPRPPGTRRHGTSPRCWLLRRAFPGRFELVPREKIA